MTMIQQIVHHSCLTLIKQIKISYPFLRQVLRIVTLVYVYQIASAIPRYSFIDKHHMLIEFKMVQAENHLEAFCFVLQQIALFSHRSSSTSHNGCFGSDVLEEHQIRLLVIPKKQAFHRNSTQPCSNLIGLLDIIQSFDDRTSFFTRFISTRSDIP